MNDEVYVIFEGHAQVDYDDYYQCWDEDEDVTRIYTNRGAAIKHLTEWIKRTIKTRPDDWTLKECTDEDDHPVHNDSIVAKAYKIVSPHEDDMDYCRVEKWNVFDKAEVPS
jgi:hypothetical protein